ncbi:GMC oxidoreductase [Melanomma pulvis-pyrius CBS 109.77]|uniref:GMC oxidoreductase n=1 Tax=Melanomma pulvis-pyrius CBS 109.77 TaxID=1314802 RepID=A0A6A6WUR2_9PLEO|nr:GMC oxidoreductase [Melanomma pulvis-pyrius CBS 109.77]
MHIVLPSILFASILLPFTTSTPVPPSSTGQPGQNITLDYIILGGGTAGLVIAARLSQASKRVAVIEAGGFYEQDAGDLSTIPANAVFGAGASPEDVLPSVDWAFVTSPQAVKDYIMHAEKRSVEGISARNYFTYQRPTISSLDKWATLVSDPSYTYANFLPYFKKSIAYTPPNNTARPANASVPSAPYAFTAGAGPLHVSFAEWANPISSFVDRAWQKLGVPVAQDFVSGVLKGVQYSMNSINPQGQVRDSSYSFLKSVVGTTGIQVYNNTLVKKILFEGNVATGALVSSGGVEYILSARKEVILTAGAFQSPQILMVSGVGPASTLNKFNIPIISALEGVGKNMQDHLLFGASYRVKPLTHSALTNSTFLAEATREYKAAGTGILGNPGGEIIAWEKAQAAIKTHPISAAARKVLASYPADWPDFEFLMLDAYSGDNQNYFQGAPKTPFMYASPAAAIMVAQSRGSVTIASTDTAVPPVIDPNWLTHPVDQELVVVAFKRMRDMMDTDIMKRAWVEELVPGRHVVSDADILSAIRQTGIQMFHASITCKMGKVGDADAVVDHRGRVFGTKQLRVIDASSMPFLPPGHPQALIYALAEKLAEDILQS